MQVLSVIGLDLAKHVFQGARTRLRTHCLSQKMKAAAKAMADRKV